MMFIEFLSIDLPTTVRAEGRGVHGASDVR